MYQAHLLHSASPGQSYDATGNRLSGKVDTTTQTYTYPATNHRLSAVVMNYQYNGRGEQVRKFLGTASTYTLYDETGHWLGDYDNNGAALQQAIWLDDLPVGMLAGNSLHYVQPDHLTTCASGETYAVGRLTRMQDGSGITDYCYDRFGDLVHKVQTTNGKVFVLRYAYTKAGQLSRLTYPDGAAVDYVRNAQGQTTEVGVTPAGGTRQVLLGNATYYPFGPVASWSYGNGRPMQRVLDQDYRPLAVSDTRSDGLSTGFAFDAAGNLSALTAAGNTAPVVSLDYDALGRLTAFKDGPTGTVIDGYSYDATGNRLSAKVNTATQNYTYPTANHRLSAVAGTARTYDAIGNTLSIGGTAQEFVYDANGRMGQAKRAGAVVMNYQYNGRGEQVRKFLGTAGTYTLYDETGHWLGDYDSTGQALQQAIWLDDLPVGVLASNSLHYLQPDHLGTPRAVIDPVRDVAIWTWDLKGEAFGNTPPNQDPDNDGTAFVFDMRFPGQRYDAATGLNQNYFRDYDPSTGRYAQSDPIGLEGGASSYAYTSSNPIDAIDPMGLQSSAIYGTGATGAGGAAGAYGMDGYDGSEMGPRVDLDNVNSVIRLTALSITLTSPTSVFRIASNICVAAVNSSASGGQVSKADCSKAMKLLSQVDRLAQKLGKKLPPKRVDELRRKINDGTITSSD